MIRFFKNTFAVFYALLSTQAYAADAVRPNAPLPVLAGENFEVEVGSRYWLSNGSYVGNLYDTIIPNQMNSRLTYNNMTGQSAEVFFRAEHEKGIFLKGFLGGGTIASGKMNDEDFPPGTNPYSNTISVQSGGSLKYVTVDLGYDLLRGLAMNELPFRIGPFIGYNNYHERMNTFGFNQVGYTLQQSLPTLFDGLDENTSWNSLRVGLGGEVTLLPGLRISLEGAWLKNWYYGADYHNQRANIRGEPETGSGQGAQTEGILSLDLTPRFSLGIGGRYWIMNAAAKAHWEQVPASFNNPLLTVSAPMGIYSQRYGGFLQAAYRFGGEKDPVRGNLLSDNFGKSDEAPHRWAGAFVGANVGYAFGNSGTTELSALSPVALEYQFGVLAPINLRSDIAGFSGGGQIGYNLKLALPIVLGVETDMSYANVGGSIGYQSPLSYFNEDAESWENQPVFTSSKSLLQWYGTARGRVGWLLRDDFLLYGTAGLAYGGITARSAIRSEFSYLPGEYTLASGQYNGTTVGWAAGAGIEYAVAQNWSLKAEWLYLGFGSQTYSLNPIPGSMPFGYNATINSDTQVTKTGLNYKLNLE